MENPTPTLGTSLPPHSHSTSVIVETLMRQKFIALYKEEQPLAEDELVQLAADAMQAYTTPEDRQKREDDHREFMQQSEIWMASPETRRVFQLMSIAHHTMKFALQSHDN